MRRWPRDTDGGLDKFSHGHVRPSFLDLPGHRLVCRYPEGPVAGSPRNLLALTFFIALLAITEFSLPKAAILLVCSQAVQTVWRAKSPVTLDRLIFNLSAVLIPMAASYTIAHEWEPTRV
jgi:hypothetical protein